MQNNKDIYISVVIPARNEEKNIVPAINNTLAALKDSALTGEIIVVNDGSKDDTLIRIKEKISENTQGNILLVNHEKPKGIGASFWDGVEKARGKIITMFPGDNENDPWETLRYVNLLEHVDMVVPFVFNREVRSVFRNALSYIYRFIINTTFRVNFNYTNGTILYRRSILSNLDYKSDGFFFQTEILIKMAKRGYLFAEVPYRLGLRPGGMSKAVTFPSFLQVTKGYLHLVKDIYFNKNVKDMKGKFADDSQSAKRYSASNR